MSTDELKLVVNNDIYKEIPSSQDDYGDERLIIIHNNSFKNFGDAVCVSSLIIASFVFGFTIGFENYRPYGYLLIVLLFLSLMGLMISSNEQRKYYKVSN